MVSVKIYAEGGDSGRSIIFEANQRRGEEAAAKVARGAAKRELLPPGMGRCWECGRIVPLSELDEDGYCGC